MCPCYLDCCCGQAPRTGASTRSADVDTFVLGTHCNTPRCKHHYGIQERYGTPYEADTLVGRYPLVYVDDILRCTVVECDARGHHSHEANW